MVVLSRSDGRQRRARAGAVALALLAFSSCIARSPEETEADELGPDTSGQPNGPFHRAGFPCTRCHGELWWQESPAFELAGTIYRNGDDSKGLASAEVVVQDAAGHELRAHTNRSGNFFLVREGSQLRQRDDGRLEVPFALVFPLRVRVEFERREQAMRGLIWRERSCAECHSGEPGATSNGRVFALRDEGP